MLDFYDPIFAGCEKAENGGWTVTMRDRWISNLELMRWAAATAALSALLLAVGLTLAFKLQEFKSASALVGLGGALIHLSMNITRAVDIRRMNAQLDGLEAGLILFRMELEFLAAERERTQQ